MLVNKQDQQTDHRLKKLLFYQPPYFLFGFHAGYTQIA